MNPSRVPERVGLGAKVGEAKVLVTKWVSAILSICAFVKLELCSPREPFKGFDQCLTFFIAKFLLKFLKHSALMRNHTKVLEIET